MRMSRYVGVGVASTSRLVFTRVCLESHVNHESRIHLDRVLTASRRIESETGRPSMTFACDDRLPRQQHSVD